jgi:hypothetical protein
MSKLYQELFEYCFPPYFKEDLRKKYNEKKQNGSPVQDYFSELALLRRRLKEITEAQHAQRAWDGADKYIKYEWALKGMRPDESTIEELKSAALDIERAAGLKRAIERQEEAREHRRNERRPRSRSPCKDHAHRTNDQRRDNRSEGAKGRGRSDYRKNKDLNGKNPNSARTNKQKDDYRAANKCFNCGEVGHMAKDCPSKNKARPSKLGTSAAALKPEAKVRASSALLKELDKLTAQKESIETSSARIYVATARTKSVNVGPKHVERNSARVKDQTRKVPGTLVVQATLQGESVRVLLDSGSQADLVSSTLVDQLKLPRIALTKPLQLQLAVTGSRGTLRYCAKGRLAYQSINEEREFDVANVDNYDIILGTPFLFQHSVKLSFNPNGVYIGSSRALPIEGANVILVGSIAADVVSARMDELRAMLKEEAMDLCKTIEETPLPPFRAINHTIPTINDNVAYKFRPSRCPEALRPLFEAKAREYIQSGRWKLATGTNAIPMLFLTKKTKDGSVKLRTVLDKREQNANTRKLASPLPNIEEILTTVCRYKYRTLLDGKDAYEQIRVEDKDVPKTLFHTPMGTMVSLVMQQGDCNAGATYQMLMNHILSAYIGVFVFVYLDDIIIFSNSIEEHVQHIRQVFEVLKREKLYLSANKMQFFASELAILGHIIDEQGIKMDPYKVDCIANWKTPVSKEQLASYLGALGYLAPNCPGIRIPMAVLTKRASGTNPFRWEGTEERAFRETQRIVEEHREHHRIALNYSKNAEVINLVTDASLTGASGVLSQGEDWLRAPIAAFWSGKFNPAQQNYSVTDREALAIICSLNKFEPLLQGTKFRILTDHKALEHLMTQKQLSGRQARWLDVLSRFDFNIKYIEGSKNVLADALSRIYSEEDEGTIRAKSEYVPEEASAEETEEEGEITRPILGGRAAQVATESTVATSEGIRRNPARVRVAPKRYDPEIPGRPGEGSATTAWRKGSRKTDAAIVTPRGVESENFAELTQPLEGDAENSTTEIVELEGEGATPNSLGVTHNPDDPTEPVHITSLVTELDVIGLIRTSYADDEQFGKIIRDLKQYPNYELDEELLYMEEHGRRYLCVPNAKTPDYNVRDLLISHAHSLVAHLGGRKTYAYMRESLWWRNMAKDVERFCESCVLCASAKAMTKKPYGQLKPLPVPTVPWSQIGVDFVGPLPESKTLSGRFDMICVVIDHLTLMVHLIPTKQTYTSRDIAEIMYTNVYRLHGLPDIIVSDRDKLFTSQYHRELHDLLGTELRLSSSYHPQTDGMTERANRTAISLIRMCVNPAQRDWAIKLPGIEFAMNSARSETTGFSPFALNYGRLPRPMLVRTQTDLLGVQEAAQEIKHAQMIAHDAIIASRTNSVGQANKGRQEASFRVGDLVYIHTKNFSIPTGKARKLCPKYVGPYKIELIVKEGATYKVELPPEMRKRGIRPVFHASLLKPHKPDEDRRFPGRSYPQVVSLQGEEDDWAVSHVADHQGKGISAMFEIVWETGDRTWEPYNVVKHLEALKQYYEVQGVRKASELPWKGGPAGTGTTSAPETLENARIHVLKAYSIDLRNPKDTLVYANSLTAHLAISLNTYAIITIYIVTMPRITDRRSYADVAAGRRGPPPRYPDGHDTLGATDNAVVQMANRSMDMTETILRAQIETNRQMGEFRQLLDQQDRRRTGGPTRRGNRAGARVNGRGGRFEAENWRDRRADVSKSYRDGSRQRLPNTHLESTGEDGGTQRRGRSLVNGRRRRTDTRSASPRAPTRHGDAGSTRRRDRRNHGDRRHFHTVNRDVDGTPDDDGRRYRLYDSDDGDYLGYLGESDSQDESDPGKPEKGTGPPRTDDPGRRKECLGPSVGNTEPRTGAYTGHGTGTGGGTGHEHVQTAQVLRTSGERSERPLLANRFQVLREPTPSVDDVTSDGASQMGGGESFALPKPSDAGADPESGYAPCDTGGIDASLQAHAGQFLSIGGCMSELPILTDEDIDMLLPQVEVALSNGLMHDEGSGTDGKDAEDGGGAGRELTTKGDGEAGA